MSTCRKRTSEHAPHEDMHCNGIPELPNIFVEVPKNPICGMFQEDPEAGRYQRWYGTWKKLISIDVDEIKYTDVEGAISILHKAAAQLSEGGTASLDIDTGYESYSTNPTIQCRVKGTRAATPEEISRIEAQLVLQEEMQEQRRKAQQDAALQAVLDDPDTLAHVKWLLENQENS